MARCRTAHPSRRLMLENFNLIIHCAISATIEWISLCSVARWAKWWSPTCSSEERVGLLVVLSVPELSKNHGKASVSQQFFCISWPLCLLVLLIAITALAADLGRFDRILKIVTVPRPTAITVGAIALAVCALGAAILSVFALSDRIAAPNSFVSALSIACIVAGAVAMSYTGILLCRQDGHDGPQRHRHPQRLRYPARPPTAHAHL